MTLKTRLITTISMFFLVIALLITGVWAASTANVNIGGTISFNATNIYATITGSITGASTTPTLSPLNYSAKSAPTTTELNTWKQNLTFADATVPTVKWTIQIQNKSERALYVTLTDNIATLANATKTLTFDNGSADGEKTIPANTTKTFTMEIKVTDTNASASVEYDFDFDLKDSSTKQILKQDDKGFYVTMGTYNNAPVVWRLVGLNGNKFTGTTAPSAGSVGTFILETNLSSYKAFGSIDDDYYNGNNDYSTSYIREYLTGNSSYALDWEGNPDDTDNGSFLTDFNISESDAVYSAIVARDMESLYTDIGWASGTIKYGQQYSPPAGTTQYATYDTTPKTSAGADKLWLMSVAEIYTMVGGGTIGADGTIPQNWSTYYDNLIWNEEYYWLRSPDPSDSYGAFAVFDGGAWGIGRVFFTNYAVRPAFNIEF
jgi:hypothetical protein